MDDTPDDQVKWRPVYVGGFDPGASKVRRLLGVHPDCFYVPRAYRMVRHHRTKKRILKSSPMFPGYGFVNIPDSVLTQLAIAGLTPFRVLTVDGLWCSMAASVVEAIRRQEAMARDRAVNGRSRLVGSEVRVNGLSLRVDRVTTDDFLIAVGEVAGKRIQMRRSVHEVAIEATGLF